MERYRFGFNGKENLNELTGSTGTHLDFGARVYDSRLGRFLSVDNFAERFSFQSPYLFAGNSPIFAIDKNGDSTLYYNSKGKLLHISVDDGLDNAVVLVPNYKTILFRIKLSAYKNKKLDQSQSANLSLRGYGDIYMTSQYQSFFNTSISIKNINTEYSNDNMTYYNERLSYLYQLDNGHIVMGPKAWTGGINWVHSECPDNGIDWSGKAPRKTGGDIHLHMNAGKPSLIPPHTGYSHGPSPEDTQEYDDQNRYFDIIVTPKYIFLYNNKNATNIVLSRTKTFEKNPAMDFQETYYERVKSNTVLEGSNPYTDNK